MILQAFRIILIRDEDLFMMGMTGRLGIVCLISLSCVGSVAEEGPRRSGMIRGAGEGGQRVGGGPNRSQGVVEGDRQRPEGAPQLSLEDRKLLMEYHDLQNTLRKNANAELKSKLDQFDEKVEKISPSVRRDRAMAFFKQNPEVRKTLIQEAIDKLKAIQKVTTSSVAAKMHTDAEALFMKIPQPPQHRSGGPGSGGGPGGGRGGPGGERGGQGGRGGPGGGGKGGPGGDRRMPPRGNGY